MSNIASHSDISLNISDNKLANHLFNWTENIRQFCSSWAAQLNIFTFWLKTFGWHHLFKLNHPFLFHRWFFSLIKQNVNRIELFLHLVCFFYLPSPSMLITATVSIARLENAGKPVIPLSIFFTEFKLFFALMKFWFRSFNVSTSSFRNDDISLELLSESLSGISPNNVVSGMLMLLLTFGDFAEFPLILISIATHFDDHPNYKIVVNEHNLSQPVSWK